MSAELSRRSIKGHAHLATSPSIRLLNKSNAAPAGALLARAFAREERLAHVLPDPAEVLRFCVLLYTANVRWSLDVGTVWAVEPEPGVLGGVVTLLDGPVADPTDAQLTAYGFDAVAAEWPELLAAADALERPALAALDLLPAPWLYINVFAVDPVFQGQGLGSHLMHHVVAEADAAGQHLGLLTDSTRNARFYKRLGFTTVLEGHEGDPLRLWAMTR